MKKLLLIIFCISFFFFQSCLSNMFYDTEEDYIRAARNAYIEYINEHKFYDVNNIDSKNFQLAESYYSKAFELNPDDLDLKNEILNLYWEEKLPDKFIYWIDIFTNTENDKYSNYLYFANYCMDYASKTNANIYLINVNYDLSKIMQDDYPETYSQEYLQNIINYAWRNGKRSFGVILWEKALECLDNAYQIKQTSEVLNLYYKIYMEYGRKFSIASYTKSGLEVTSLTFMLRPDVEKAHQYLTLSLQLEDNWETHYLKFKERMSNEVNFHGGAYNDDFIPKDNNYSWRNIKNDLELIEDIFQELDKSIDLASGEEKAKLIYEKANFYFYSLRDYDKAKLEYEKVLALDYKTGFINKQILNCDKQKQNDLIYLECASLLGLKSIDEYLSYLSRTNYRKLYDYLMTGSYHEPYKYNDLILVPEEKLSIIDFAYQDGYFVYLISSQCANQLSKCCLVISPVQLNSFYYNEYIITDLLLLKYIGEDGYRSYGNFIKCDLFQNIAVGTDEYDYYKDILLKIHDLNSKMN